jgi:hypothetical protein
MKNVRDDFSQDDGSFRKTGLIIGLFHC